MLDPPPMIEFLKLRACLVRIKGLSCPQMGHMQLYSNTEKSYSIVARQRTSVGFKLRYVVTLEKVAW